MNNKDLSVIILAAGKGKRMKSDIPKALHTICYKPMIYYVLKEAYSLGPKDIHVIVGHKAALVKDYIKSCYDSVKITVQKKQLGTAHAVSMLQDKKTALGRQILILTGDMPLIRAATLKRLLDKKRKEDLDGCLLTTDMSKPFGYGRIIKDKNGALEKIVEESDANAEQKKIKEVNTSIYCFSRDDLFDNLDVGTKNSQNEYYLTDVIEKMIEKGFMIRSLKIDDQDEVSGINDRVQLSNVEAVLKSRICKKLMMEGVSIRDPNNTFIEDTVMIQKDTIIEPYCFIKGKTDIGTGCRIGPFCQISDTRVGKNTHVNSSMIAESDIGEENIIGPNSYIRPGTITKKNVKIGAFCEIKKSRIDNKSKVPHLSYVGDTEIGQGVNIGASSVTLNYNGFTKSKTIIEDDVFIGSDTMLVAPVRIGKGAIVAAGSVISKDVPENSLAIERGTQKNIKEGATRYRKKKKMQG